MNDMTLNTLPQGAERRDDGAVRYTFSEPATLPSTNGGEDRVLTELVIRKPLSGDLIDAGTDDNKALFSFNLLCALSGQTDAIGKSLMRRLAPRDYLACQSVVAAFFNNGQTTGL
ncbi:MULTISPECIES: phage tail assembly protein [unclassified Saccharibacter]|uniref:phage tail assembly protein n=1 Tax=unclassified Saccharibacter TaxID=2648722 RepID=UPI001323B73C|nr:MULTISPECIES: phage tail assembly protein [unclassified Saccharibacter]MXV35842.1 hypothetical protein [Saccharibacter sp. EH611]MXV57963.1 hypothetical protein [Saccharibacter sp. EH70]MXV66358.1 hypothetical protein [Saccharibacter sp. EH60]